MMNRKNTRPVRKGSSWDIHLYVVITNQSRLSRLHTSIHAQTYEIKGDLKVKKQFCWSVLSFYSFDHSSCYDTVRRARQEMPKTKMPKIGRKEHWDIYRDDEYNGGPFGKRVWVRNLKILHAVPAFPSRFSSRQSWWWRHYQDQWPRWQNSSS